MNNTRRIRPPRPACTHTEGAYHDCDYVDQRDALISQAERLATERCEPGQNWTRLFFAAMDELWRARTAAGEVVPENPSVRLVH
jgi:hypothetical protein